ncbi:MAG TPA: MraY family glycosyltransferase [Actinomycetota bacterium]|nr:MraY family glycosyltransferase [Actinomycetota bacterium]
MEPLLAAAIGFLASIGITPLAGKLAHRFGVLDHPDSGPEQRKMHSVATPYLGGVAIFTGLAAGAVFLLLVGPTETVLTSRRLLLGIGLAIAVGIVGLVDDIKPLPSGVRLAVQIGAALGAWAVGFRAQPTDVLAVNFILTTLWIVGITNSFNLLDNMDGLSSGLAAIAAGSFAIMGVLEGLTLIPIVAGALAGAAFGFLVHNRPPARIFMGDAGSLFLGFLLAVIGIELRFDNLVQVTFLVPVVVLGLPIFDTTLVVLSRLRSHRPIGKAARDHVSHRLIAIGLPVKEAVLLLYWTAICLGWLGMIISRANTQVGWMLLVFVFALGIFFGRLLWQVPTVAPGTLAKNQARLDAPVSVEARQKVAE